MKKLFLTAAATVILSGAYFFGTQPQAIAQTEESSVIDLSELALSGQEYYNSTCAVCHGVNLVGTNQGPPFLNRVYAAGHHSDMAFVLAVKLGTRAHHFRFGPMSAIEGISDEQIGAIITYIREVQAANGF